MKIEMLTLQVLGFLFVVCGLLCCLEILWKLRKAKLEDMKPKPMAQRVMAGIRPVYPDHEVELRWLYEGTEYASRISSIKDARAILRNKVPAAATGVRISYFDKTEGCEAIMYTLVDGEFKPYGPSK